MPRGFTWGRYIDQFGNAWAMQVDADHALSPQRGWVGSSGIGLAPFPRGWIPRAVVGIEPDGTKHQAVVASELADLWTGSATTFDIERSDAGIETCTVIRRLAERSRMPSEASRRAR